MFKKKRDLGFGARLLEFSIIGCASLCKYLSCSIPQLLHLQNGDNTWSGYED